MLSIIFPYHFRLEKNTRSKSRTVSFRKETIEFKFEI